MNGIFFVFPYLFFETIYANGQSNIHLQHFKLEHFVFEWMSVSMFVLVAIPSTILYKFLWDICLIFFLYVCLPVAIKNHW